MKNCKLKYFLVTMVLLMSLLVFFLYKLPTEEGNIKVVQLDQNILSSVTPEIGSHIAFPDFINLCGNALLTYREGNSHASDKGVVKVAVLDGEFYNVKSIIKDPIFDVRNPYFVFENKNLYVYTTIFDFKNSERGFIKSRLYQVSSGCDFISKPIFVKDVLWSVVYMPLNLSTASFGLFNKDRDWCVSIFENQRECLKTFDEEMSLLSIGEQYVGVLRNHPKVGLPFEYLKYNSKGKLIKKINWCDNYNSNSALVSPRLYVFNGNYFVAYAEREIYRGNLERASVWVKLFNTLEDLEGCRPAKIFKTPDAVGIDYGYPVIGRMNGNLLLVWYGSSGGKINLFSANIPS